MNIKLHTPKSLKMGSGMSSLKQFLLSLFATTVSIALTFGTAGIIDNYKKQKEKREIVMMVMYDMYRSLQTIEEADSNLNKVVEIQISLAEDTTKFDSLKFYLATLTPKVEYTETTEHIFSSSIETINTVGNVLFTENVANFYQNRQSYKTMICDSINNDLRKKPLFYSLASALEIDFIYYKLASSDVLNCMQRLFAECKQIMDVTNEEIEAYRKEREEIEKSLPGQEEKKDSIMKAFNQQNERMNQAMERIQHPKGDK